MGPVLVQNLDFAAFKYQLFKFCGLAAAYDRKLVIEVAVLVGGGVGLATVHQRLAVVYFIALVVHYATTRRRLAHVLSFR